MEDKHKYKGYRPCLLKIVINFIFHKVFEIYYSTCCIPGIARPYNVNISGKRFVEEGSELHLVCTVTGSVDDLWLKDGRTQWSDSMDHIKITGSIEGDIGTKFISFQLFEFAQRGKVLIPISLEWDKKTVNSKYSDCIFMYFGADESIAVNSS